MSPFDNGIDRHPIKGAQFLRSQPLLKCQVNQFLIPFRKAIHNSTQLFIFLIFPSKKNRPFRRYGHIVPHYVSNHGKRRLFLPKSHVIIKTISEDLQEPWKNGILIHYLLGALTETEGYILVNILRIFTISASRPAQIVNLRRICVPCFLYPLVIFFIFLRVCVHLCPLLHFDVANL